MKISKQQVIELIKSDEPKDLHIHSYYSDGELEPTVLVDAWMNKGFRLISITDHDVVEGSKIACKYAEDKDVTVIPGIEFDSEDALGTKLHILGYGIDLDNQLLKDKLALVQKWRDERNQSMLSEFRKRGYSITQEEILSINGGRFVGRPTFAKVLVRRGDFSDVNEAFDHLIQAVDDDKIVKKRTLASRDVVETIHEAGGLAILAHPIEQKKRGESWTEFQPRLIKLLDTFVGYGIDGIECYHPSASDEQSEYLEKYAIEHNLLITKGSDFHSENLNRDYSRYHK